MDMIARLDEEQFGLLLMDCNAFGGLIAAERFLAELTPLLNEHQLPFNAGIAAWKDSMARPDDLMVAAEQGLDTARSFGPGRIEVQHG
jgi:GGDEF domain-containing protein